MAGEERSLNFGRLVLDAWTALSHKAPVGDSGPTPMLVPGWVPQSDKRRLAAYLVLHAYARNVARHYVDVGMASGSVAMARQRREYGDPAQLVETLVDSALGQTFAFAVEHAGDEDPAAPTEEDVTDGGPSLAELTTEFEQRRTLIEQAQTRQKWFDAWANDEQATRKIVEAETMCATLGDVVYLVSWSNKKQRVRLRWYDPGFYFPVLDEYDDDGFPNKVHLAWEYDDPDGVTWLRRITFELVDLPIGEQSRRYAYAPDVDSSKRCVMTDMRWRMDKLSNGLLKLADGDGYVNTNTDGDELFRFDLGIDFIPVVHVPCFPAGDEHFGESGLSRVAQALDDLAASDTDRQTTSALVGSPPIAISGTGGQGEVSTYGPGQLFRLRDGGKMDILDTSNALSGLTAYIDELRARVAQNRGLPQVIIGSADVEKIASGVLALLSFGPYTRLVNRMRLARAEKYELLAKFVQRLAVIGGDLESGASEDEIVARTELAFGAFLPNDLPTLLRLYMELTERHLLSRATALRLMKDAGLDIDDLEAELDRIHGEDFDGAKALADATNRDTDAISYLGLDETTATLTPPENVPPLP